MDSLIVLNESNFFVCKSCGYTEIHEENFSSHMQTKKSHKNSSGYDCINKDLYKYSLGHEFKTDVIIIKFPMYNESTNIAVAWTILFSLLEGLSKCLNIDRNELSGCLQWYTDDDCSGGNYGFVLFDNTPGGAGCVRQLEDKSLLSDMFKMAYNIVSHCDCGGELQDTACYSCLCNYYNQKQHEIIKRKYAIKFFEYMLGDSNEFVIDNDEMLYEYSCNVDNLSYHTDLSSVNYNVQLRNGSGRLLAGTEIWDELLEDCLIEDSSIIINMKQKLSYINDLIYYCQQFSVSGIDDKIFTATLTFPEKKIMLFLSDEDYMEGYEIVKKSDWKSFCTAYESDISDFIMEVNNNGCDVS